jgi:CIC family chloride channel protein
MARRAAPLEARRLAAHKPLSSFALAVLAIVLGIVAGFGAFAFRGLIAFFHNLLFLGQLSVQYDTNQHTPPSPWGFGIVLVPGLGAIVVVFLVKNFAPEAKGHGVPEVMDAIYYKKGVIRPVVAVVKSFASAISIGSGGSVGREGPIIQIGAAFASFAGRVAGASRWQLATLVAAGGGAGIAATFNTPIGGVLFAVEVLLLEVSVRTLVPVTLATATATYVGRFLLGSHPAFEVPALLMPVASRIVLLPAYLVLGAIMAFASTAFIRSLYGAEDLFEAWLPKHDYIRHVLGMLGVGAIAFLFMRASGHYYVEGVGYSAILDILSGTLHGIGFLLILALAKLFVTSLTLGSGASGGVFSPSLFMGAALGAAYGVLLRRCFPGLEIDPAAFALAGMAGIVAGATGAALTAVVMIFEMTLDYSVVLPMALTVAVSYGLRRYLCPDSIYTMKLSRRGEYMPQALQANAHLLHHISEMTLDPATVMPANAPIDQLDSREDPGPPPCIVLVDGDQVTGVLTRDWVLGHHGQIAAARQLRDVASQTYVTVGADSTILSLLALIVGAHASVAVVVSSSGGRNTVLGVITNASLVETFAEGMALFAD